MKERMDAEQETMKLAELLEQEKLKREKRLKEAENKKVAQEAKLREEEDKQKRIEEEEAKRIEKVCFMCTNRKNVLNNFLGAKT